MTDTARTYLDFERPLAELDGKIDDLMALQSADGGVDMGAEIEQLRKKSDKQLASIYKKIGPWEKTKVARHEQRPHFSNYVEGLVSDYTPLSGDRKFGDDDALQGGLGRLLGRPVVVMGHEKGNDTASRIKHNFGMGVPFVSVITGEGGSGGAVAIATADSVMMLEHSIYSVISPEGCASILWRDAARAEDAAKAMKITAIDLKDMRIVDEIIEEPVGGAHRDAALMIKKKTAPRKGRPFSFDPVQT